MRLRPLARRSVTALLAFGLALPAACGGGAQTAPHPSAPQAISPHARFEAWSFRFLTEFLGQFPNTATTLGDHSHDGQWPDVSAGGDRATLVWIEATSADLASLTPSLEGDDKDDASIVMNFLSQARFDLTERRERDHSPLYYTGLIGDGFDPLVSREFAPFSDRMKSLRERLLGVSKITAAAKSRLVHSPRIATETAILQTAGLIGLCEKDLAEVTPKLPPSDQPPFESARKAATEALHAFQQFLEKDLLPRSDGSFRTGKEAFTKIVRFTLDDATLVPEELVKDARAAMATTREEMVATSLELWPSLMKGPMPTPKTEQEKRAVVKSVLDKLAEERSGDLTLLSDAKTVLAEATAFVGAKGLMTLPTEPCSVVLMPEYKRGVAVAYCDSAGPLEPKPETLVSLAPPPAEWPAARRESQYREYNMSMLKELLVHEAMPGHYLQLMHANHIHDKIRAVLQDGAYVEGWAVYSEWLMAKYGFGGPKVRLERQKMLLRAATNTVLDYEVHAGTMEEKEALAMMMNEGFQEEGEAVGKWRRARLSSGQLSSYFYGYREHMKIREAAEKAPGFHELAYHDKILALGAPPMRIVRAKMAEATLASVAK